METEKPKVHHGKRFKIFYTVQTDTYPFRIRIFCNQEMRLEESYERYLKRGIVDNFKLDGCPIQFEFVGKPKRYRKEKV